MERKRLKVHDVKNNVSMASVRRVWSLYSKYISAFVAVSKLEYGDRIDEDTHARLRHRVEELAYDMAEAAGLGSSFDAYRCFDNVERVWEGIARYPSPFPQGQSSDRYGRVFCRLSRCDDLMRYAVLSRYKLKWRTI